MFGLVRKKTLDKTLRLWGLAEHAFREEEERLGGIIGEKERLINSTERKTILADLELALNLMQAYQRALSLVSASDPNIIKANALLEKYGKQGDSNATILGAQPRGKVASKDIADRIAQAHGEFVFDSASSKSRWEQEEEYYGAEAYGSGTVRIEAEPIDEGDDKEPGYTRARIRFVDMDAPEDPPVLVAAKATTEDASQEN